MILGILLLLTGLTISAVAIYYSVLGLAAIFAAATIPIYIMGGTLEIAKLVAATWLKANWNRATGFIKWYMSAAVFVLMLITSMGIFGFLSKAHLDQSVPTGDVAAQVALIDEKIKTQRDNIEASRAALAQMDSQVNQRLTGRNADQSAERSVQIRRQQAPERTRLQKEIGVAQAEIAKLNEQRAPVASQLRKVEAEVGPIKYIAQFVYGQEADANLLEKAVTWVIILIVLVFDPLAIAMLLAAQMTFGWYRKDKEQENAVSNSSNDNVNNIDENMDIRDRGSNSVVETVIKRPDDAEVKYDDAEVKPLDTIVTAEKKQEVSDIVSNEDFDISKHPYLFEKFKHFENLTPIVATPEPKVIEVRETFDHFEYLTEPVGEVLREDKPELVVTADTTQVTVDEPTYQILPELVEESSKKKIHDQEVRESSDSREEVTYIQNSEQQETSLWKRIRERESEEFKAKDYLRFVYAKSAFEDFQYDAESNQDLDKFIKDIKTGTHSFSDYTTEDLKLFASKIYELRKN